MNSETFTEDRTTPFYDPSLSVEERIDWLLEHLTLEEKCSLIGSSMPDLPRLCIRGVGVGGEAAHGVQQRNDWAPGLPAPEPTTSFPQPIGMSATWDKERIRRAGEVTGIEARVIAHRHNWQGLSRWAPTVDLERDPRWGRNEEGYGEDPHLTGEMAGNYILGMQGDDPFYLRCASTLKHFYGNNTEEGRGYKNATISPRNREELYLETFRHVARVGHPQGVMTAYNKINGVVGMFNPEVQKVLKDACGIVHAVSDGAAPDLARSMHHRYGTDAEVVAAALKAGIDGLVTDRKMFEPAAKEALELGLITEEDLNRAIRNLMITKIRLGVYDRETVNPYDNVTEADLGSEENAKISLDLAHASLVLLKNDGILPLDVETMKGGSAERVPLALIGPLGDRWDQDWYGGEPMYKYTLKQGLEKILGKEIRFDDGLDRVTLYKGGRPMRLQVEKKPEGAGEIISLYAGQAGEQPEVFVYEDYGDFCISLRSTTYGRYLVPLKAGYGEEGRDMPETENGKLVLGPEVQFDWFAAGAFRFEGFRDDIVLKDRWNRECGTFTRKVVSKGAMRAGKLAAEADNVILALGGHPMIPAKEELDRKCMDLPEKQEELLKTVAETNPNTVMMLFANYPYILPAPAKMLRAILMSATGSQDMGRAAADALLGLYAPAGRLVQTWYKDSNKLPSIDNYDIMGERMTYRYFEGEVEYPFGAGKTYTTFRYSDLKAEEEEDEIRFTLKVTNTGERTSDEVVQIYACFEPSLIRLPRKQLVAFARIHDVQPGETRTVRLICDRKELRYYSVIASKMQMIKGRVTFMAGSSSADEDLQVRESLLFEGDAVEDREDSYELIAADHYAYQKDMEITEGFRGRPAITAASHEGRILTKCRKGSAFYSGFFFCGEEEVPSGIRILLRAGEDSSLTVRFDDIEAAYWSGNTQVQMPGTASSESRYIQKDMEEYFRTQPARFAYLELPFSEAVREEIGLTPTLALELKGDVEIVQFCFLKKE